MNKELATILLTKIGAYNQKVSDFRKFALSKEELEMFASAMQEYADELEKKNESLRSSLSASERFRMQDAAEHLDDNLLLRKENKELKESYDILKYDSDVAIQQYWSSQNEIAELKEEIERLKFELKKAGFPFY